MAAAGSTVAETIEPVPLLPRGRIVGSMLGAHTSVRRGDGADVAGSRPYRPGDHSRTIDWKASARLSSVSGNDDFIVRERYAHEMPRVVVVCDRRPEMGLYPPELPWLSKREATERVVELIAVSAINQRGLVGYLDFGGHGAHGEAGTPYWRSPRAHAGTWEGNLVDAMREHVRGTLDAPSDTLDRALVYLSILPGSLPTGSFVFVVSDFLVPPRPESWAAAIDRTWDVVAVIVQDPVWEQSFPPIAGIVTPFVAAGGDELEYVRLSKAEVEERRDANEGRLARLETQLLELGIDSITISSSAADDVRRAFLDWAELRQTARGFRQ